MARSADELIRASMGAPVRGSAEVRLVAVAADGSQRPLATWPVDGLAPSFRSGSHPGWADRLLLSVSPDGTRAAVAIGTRLFTFATADGEVLSTRTIAHSRPQLVFGWTPAGEPVARDTEDPNGPDVPLPGGWTLRVSSVIDHDHGFGSGHHSSSLGMAWRSDQSAEELAEAAAQIRAQHATGPGRVPPFRLSLLTGGHEIVVADEPVRPAEGYPSITWPPVVLPAGVLLRRTISRSWLEEPRSPLDPGVQGEETVLPAWLVSADGAVGTIPVELSQSPLCALPDGRPLLPGADPLWRDGADQPLTAMDFDGTLTTLLVEGEPATPSRILAACAPELLGEQAADDADGDWEFEDDFWIQAARVSTDASRLIVLLAEDTWNPDHRAPERCRWVVASLPLTGDGAVDVIARGDRAAGDQVAIAL